MIVPPVIAIGLPAVNAGDAVDRHHRRRCPSKLSAVAPLVPLITLKLTPVFFVRRHRVVGDVHHRGHRVIPIVLVVVTVPSFVATVICAAPL